MELHACYFKDLGAFSTDQRRASATAGKLEPGRLVSAIGLLIPQCRPGRTTKTPRLQGNLSRRSRSYGHSMGVNTPARKSALVEGDAELVRSAYELTFSPSELSAADRETSSGAIPDVPPVLLQMVAFPYSAGPKFVGDLMQAGGRARVDAARPPACIRSPTNF